MSLPEEFEKAQQNVKKLPSRPANEELLDLYALYKQAIEGDVSGKKPGRLDMTARAKYEAWEKRKGMSKDDAMQNYVEYVTRLESRHRKS